MSIDLFSEPTSNQFANLCNTVLACVKCQRMSTSQRVLNRSAGALNAEIMFIGEAPGRLGADDTGIPFHGDRAGHNFEELLKFANISREQIFVTNSILCNPKDEKGNNSTPTKDEISNCADHLREQISIVNPKIVVTLGATALYATSLIEHHSFTLKNSVRTFQNWFNRGIIPLYHPGQRAMLHRNFINQRSDYQFVSEILHRIGKKKILKRKVSFISNDIVPILDLITTLKESLSYFALHKIFYLIELEYFKRYHHRLTNAYIVRQKDGPYCTDLHYTKIKKSVPSIRLKNENNILVLHRHLEEKNLFSDNLNNQDTLTEDVKNVIEYVINKYGSKDNSTLKTQVYLTKPMRKILEQEKTSLLNLYNTPISFV